MKNQNNQSGGGRYSIAALIVALLALIATILLAITRGMVGLGVSTVSNVQDLNRYIYVSAGFIVLGLAAYAILEPDRVRRFITGRQARYGSNALVMSVAFLGILIIGNVLAFQNPVPLLDLTEDKVNTLAPETLAAFEKLPENVTATAFFTSNSNTDTARQLLDKLKANSRGKFDYKFIDPDLDPQAALAAGITGDGKILLEMGEQKEIIAFASETEMLKGLARLLNPGANAIYFLTGHGESDIEQSGDTSMTRAKSTLEGKNYSVKTLNLLVENQIPADASAVIIAGPVKPVSENEVKLLKDYLAQGGSLIVMENPLPLTEFGDSSDPLADLLATDWGIVLNNDIVIDLRSSDPSYAVSMIPYGSHAITRNMNNVVSFYPFTRSITAAGTMEGVTLSPLVNTSDGSWGEEDFESLRQGGQVSLGEGETQGPLTLAMAGENTTTGGRVVVFGTSLFAGDKIFDSYGNGDMFVNSVDWSAEQEDLPNITTTPPTQRTFIPPTQTQLIGIWLGSVCILPGLVVLAGVSAWFARRRQG